MSLGECTCSGQWEWATDAFGHQRAAFRVAPSDDCPIHATDRTNRRPCSLPDSAPPCIGCKHDCEWTPRADRTIGASDE